MKFDWKSGVETTEINRFAYQFGLSRDEMKIAFWPLAWFRLLNTSQSNMGWFMDLPTFRLLEFESSTEKQRAALTQNWYLIC